MGSAQGLVQIEETKVEVCLFRSGDSKNPVDIRLIVSADAACFVYDTRVLCDVGIEYPDVFGIGDEQARCSFRYSSLESLHIW